MTYVLPSDCGLMLVCLQLNQTENFDERKKIRARLRELRELKTGACVRASPIVSVAPRRAKTLYILAPSYIHITHLQHMYSTYILTFV